MKMAKGTGAVVIMEYSMLIKKAGLTRAGEW